MINVAQFVPAYIGRIFKVLRENGKHGYLVGGSLRDILRGVAPHDFDMTTDATPDEMLQIFADWRIIPTGLKHGTVTVLSEDHPVEITTHRTDGTYTDSRHPDSVSFTTRLGDDLARRDFTVNAMAWSEESGLVDLFGGMVDLQNGILRAVGDPERRFSEDALRILRCYRFAAQLDFTVDEDTARAAKKQAARLRDIAAERIFAELSRMLISPAAEKGLAGLLAAGCAPYVFFNATPHTHALPLLASLPPDAAQRLAALLSHNSTDTVRATLAALRTSKDFAAGVCAYLNIIREDIPKTPYEARRFVCHHFPHAESGLVLKGLLLATDTAASVALCRRVLRDGTAVEIRRLAVNGKELQERAGVRPEKTAALLTALQDRVWQEPNDNKRDTLLSLATTIVKKENWL
ncbi:MAG: hypothetical protein IJF31_00895 [Clostridia bacterium]|nr:hypothetical protein [Clostridia bacterium]